MATFVVEFSPPVKVKSKQDDDNMNTVEQYSLILAPFQKPTQIEFVNIKMKETAVRCLTVVNPFDQPKQFVLPYPSDGIFFDVHEFTLQPNSQRELLITWQPLVSGNIRKLIKIEQVDNKRKYELIVLGNCIAPTNKNLKGNSVTYSKSKNSNLVKTNLNCGKKRIIMNKTRVVNSKSERIVLVENPAKKSKSISTENIQTPARRETYLIEEKENLSNLKTTVFSQDNIFTSPFQRLRRADNKLQNYDFNNDINIADENLNCSLDSLSAPLKKTLNCYSPFNDFCLTPLKSTENLLSPFSTTSKSNSFNTTNIDLASISFNTTMFKPIEASTADKMYEYTPIEERKPSRVSVNLNNIFDESDNNFNRPNNTYLKELEQFITPPNDEKSLVIGKTQEWVIRHAPLNHTKTTVKNLTKRPSFAIRNSPFYKCSPKSPFLLKNRLKQSIHSPRPKCLRTSKLDKCDQYLKCLANPELVHHSNAEDPFLKLSKYYAAEWLDRQESDMIRWLNELLMPSDKLADEEQSDDLKHAVGAWEEVSKMSHRNKPMQFATQKDLFVAHIYRQSPQKWSALRKATFNLITSNKVASVLSKLTVSIEKDLITVRDDRQIHLDLSLKKKITDLLNCYNPLWLRIGLEAIYGQVICVKLGSNDLDGLGWFIRKNLFNNDFVKQKFTKTTILQVNLPLYNIAMKKFILRKILMLIYFLDFAKEQQLIRHNPCLFKIDSPYKSSYDFLMGFCADMVTAHGDIIRRLRNIDYNLKHKQTHLDEVNYAVKSLNDLRDGTRITKVVEILFKGDSLSHKLRLPAISKLQKIHNVDLALNRISEHIKIEGNICTRDIVNGHREKILSLFWQIIYKYLTPRYTDAALKIQHWWRKNSLNLVILKKIRIKRNLKLHFAATKIQSYVRGYLTRKRWLHTKAKLIEERKRFLILKKATIFIQRKFRYMLARRRNQRKSMQPEQAVLLIQKMFRGFIIRKNWLRIQNCLEADKIKRINAINIIKRALRKNLPPSEDQLYYQNLMRVTLTIQRRFRANHLMKLKRTEYLMLKEKTIVLQRKFRAKQSMVIEKELYLKLKIAVLKLQTVARGYIVRKQWPELRSKLQANKMHLIISSNIIKRVLRKNLPPTSDRIKFLMLKKSVTVLQMRFRAMRDMNEQRKKYLHLRTVTIKCQSVIRGYLLRKQWPLLRYRLIINRQYLIRCSNVIKRALRKNLPPTDDRIKFLMLKKSVTVLQMRFRAMRDMNEQRKKYLHLRTVTIKCQSVIRGYLLRKQWPLLRYRLIINRQYLIRCSNVIKRALRKNLPPTDDRIKFLMLKKSVTVLQMRFRAMRDMNEQRKKYLHLRTVTIKCQSVIRGYLLRKQWPLLRYRLIINRQYLIRCSNVIKRALRKNLPPTDDRIKFLMLKKSVTVLQMRFRAMRDMNEQRKKYLHLRTVTIKCQSVIRGYLLRKQWPLMRNKLIANRQYLIKCSNVIKSALRNNLPTTDERLEFINLRKATIIIQNRFRSYRQVKQYQTLRNNVILIQRRFKANIAMRRQKQNYEHIRTMIIRLQTQFRGYLVRKKWPETKCILEANQKQLILASNTIKKFLRKCLPPTSERLRYLQLRQAVIYLQAKYRSVVAMKLSEREYLLLRNSAIILQNHYRAHKAMMAQKLKYKRLKYSTIVLQAYVRGYLTRKRWPELKNYLEISKIKKTNTLIIENLAALKIQAIFRGFMVRKKLPQLKNDLRMQKQMNAATLIQAQWRGYCVRKKVQCRRETIKMPKKGGLTLGRRHNDVVNVLTKQKRNEYSYRDLAMVFWNLDTCTSLSKELCVKTSEGNIVDYMFHFLQSSNQSQPSIEAREPAIRVLINILRYQETSWHIWTRTVNTGMVNELIKMMKTCCGKICSNKLYCSIATWLWVALQDPKKKHYIKTIPGVNTDFKFMLDTLNKRYKNRKMNKTIMVLPSTLPTWSIGSKCQKCFDSDLYATTQLCKLLNL